MVLNNFVKDVTMLCKRAETTKKDISKKIGKSTNYASMIGERIRAINEGFVQLVDACGYDVEVRYIPKSSTLESKEV